VYWTSFATTPATIKQRKYPNNNETIHGSAEVDTVEQHINISSSGFPEWLSVSHDTLCCKAAAHILSSEWVHLFQVLGSSSDFLRYLLAELGINKPINDLRSAQDSINQLLLEQFRDRRPVIIGTALGLATVRISHG